MKPNLVQAWIIDGSVHTKQQQIANVDMQNLAESVMEIQPGKIYHQFFSMFLKNVLVKNQLMSSHHGRDPGFLFMDDL